MNIKDMQLQHGGSLQDLISQAAKQAAAGTESTIFKFLFKYESNLIINQLISFNKMNKIARKF